MKEPKKNIIHQFNDLKEKREIAKKNRSQKGPVDLKEVRRVLNNLNQKNRMPS